VDPGSAGMGGKSGHQRFHDPADPRVGTPPPGRFRSHGPRCVTCPDRDVFGIGDPAADPRRLRQ